MHSRPRPVIALVAAAVVVGVTLPLAGFGLGSAQASEGSVPRSVIAFIDSELVPEIDDLYGKDASGGGIDFDDTTATGTPFRVFEFTTEFLAGDPDAVAVRRLNEWVTTVSVTDAAVGLATIALDESTSDAVLGSFVPDASLAAALAQVPDDASLVRVADSGAWFALAGSTLTPLEAGTSGVDSEIPVAEYADAAADPAEPSAAAASDDGLLIAGIVLGIALLSVLAFALMSRRTRPPSERPTPIE